MGMVSRKQNEEKSEAREDNQSYWFIQLHVCSLHVGRNQKFHNEHEHKRSIVVEQDTPHHESNAGRIQRRHLKIE
jgi:hypothetical protein